MKYVNTPGSPLVLPEHVARDSLARRVLQHRHGAYRSADGNNKNIEGWRTTDGSADGDTLGDLRTIRRQSRDLLRNDGFAVGPLRKSETSVVGSGLVPQASIDADYLGLDEAQASAWQRDAERVFRCWARPTTADVERRVNFAQMQALVFRAMLESGDAFVLRRYTPRPGALLGISCQVIEADRVINPADADDTDRLRAGVELDDLGAPTAYHIADVHPGDTGYFDRHVHTRRVPAFDDAGDPMCLHVGKRLRPGQTRGMPYLSPVIEQLKQLSRYSEAEVTAAVISAYFAVFVTSPLADANILDNAAPGISFDGTVHDGIPPRLQSRREKLQSGLIAHLAPGEDIRSMSASRPNAQFDPFVQSVLRQISMGLGLSYEVMLGHFQSSYSASRAALIETWRHFERERAFLVDQFCDPVYSWVISNAIAVGLLDAPGFFDDPMTRDAWLGCDWIGQGMPQIDPLKDAKAETAWHDLGVRSLQDISAAQGRDFDRVRAQLLREQREAQALGLRTGDEVAPPLARDDEMELDNDE